MLERNDLMRQRLAKIDGLRALHGGIAYPNDFRPTHSAADALRWFAADPQRLNAFVALPEGEPMSPDVPPPTAAPLPQAPWTAMAGRVVAINVKGKVAFLRILDRTAVELPALRRAEDDLREAAGLARREQDTATFQFYFSRETDPDTFDRLFKPTPGAAWEGPLLDVGDTVGGVGLWFRTRTGEPSLWLRPHGGPALRLLAKAVRPLPEKWHGLQDKELRHRQRYVDLVVNDAARATAFRRAAVLREVRRFFDDHGYIEVETPMMHPVLGGAAARPFRTHHNALDMPLFLRIAPELYLKRLVVGGLERVYEINRNFRNEGLSQRHNPEFTMLEFYRAYATWHDLIDEVEALLAKVAVAVTGATSVPYGVDAEGQPRTLSFARPFRRVTIRQGLLDWAALDEDQLDDLATVRRRAGELGCALPDHAGLGKAQVELFEHVAQPHLFQPTFVMGYPADTSPLARRSDTEPGLVDRFELFAAHIEISNAFSELNDPVDQYERFLLQLDAKARGDDEAMEMDLDYVRALEYGMPPTGGCGIGIDRLVMLLTNTDSIREVILFPHMRPEARAPEPALAVADEAGDREPGGAGAVGNR
ncbi:MAG: lysine--tRNA ligase [Myxococcales bacterium]|nr:lysine--tRNA ligase [Myxococcales bacterium]